VQTRIAYWRITGGKTYSKNIPKFVIPPRGITRRTAEIPTNPPANKRSSKRHGAAAFAAYVPSVVEFLDFMPLFGVVVLLTSAARHKTHKNLPQWSARQLHREPGSLVWRQANAIGPDITRFNAEHPLIFVISEIGHLLGFRHPWVPYHRRN